MSLNRISEIERISILTRLILKYCDNFGLIDSIKLAKDLGNIIDELNFFNIDLKKLEAEFVNYFPGHWKKRTQFLLIITKYWPKILTELEKLDIDPKTQFKSKLFDSEIECVTDGLTSEIIISDIKNKISIFESEDIFQEIEFIIGLIKNNLKKNISIVSVDKNLSELLSYRLKFENLKYTSFVNNPIEELTNEFLDEISKCFGDFKNLSESEMKKLIKELSIFSKPIKQKNPISIIGSNDIKFSNSDILILTELNESSWKNIINGEYWLHTCIRKKLKFNHESNRHIENDFYACFNNKSEIFITRSKKTESINSTKSSILSKFEIKCKKKNVYIEYMTYNNLYYMNKCNSTLLLNNELFIIPDELNVRNLELLMKDPYVFYANDVLGLNSNDIDKEKHDFWLAFKNIMRSYFEDKNKMDSWLNLVKELDFFCYQKCINIIRFLDKKYKKTDSYNNILGKIKYNNFELYGFCDRVETNNTFSSIINYRITSLGSAKDILYGDDCAIMATCFIAERGGFSEIKKPIREIQIWTIGNSPNEPLSIKSLEISKELINNFEERLNKILINYSDPKDKLIDLKNTNNKLKYNKYKHFERI